MKTQFRVLLLIFPSLFYFPSLEAQPEHWDFDSISVSKPKRQKFLYEFQDPFLSSVAIKSDGWISRPKEPGEGLGSFAGNIGMEAFGSIIGSTNSTKKVICHPVGKLKCNDSSLDWEVTLSCPGVMNTSKEKTDDGVSVIKTAIMDWKETASGIITERGDTICVFDIISDPGTNPKVNPWSNTVFAPRQTRYPIPEDRRVMNYRMDNLFDFYEDYGIIGTFRDEQFLLLFNREQGESWLFRSDSLKMIFYGDIDDFEYVPKKDRLVPYIKWVSPNSSTEKHDLLRLATASRYLTKILRTGSFPL
jgi:hypothetical protein